MMTYRKRVFGACWLFLVMWPVGCRVATQGAGTRVPAEQVYTLPGPCIEDTYRGGRLTSHIEYTYGRSGELLTMTINRRGDEHQTMRTRYAYRSNGARALEETDMGLDGVVDQRTVYRYDEAGRLTTQEVDLNVDGTIDETLAYTYDAKGVLTTLVEENDDETTTHSYDDLGRLLSTERVIWPDHHDEHREISTFTYDAKGNLIGEVHDASGSGMSIRRVTHTYDASGHRVTSREDDNNDGVADRRSTYVYDTRGYHIATHVDEGNDGGVDQRVILTYDVSGQQIGMSIDSPIGGEVETQHVYDYGCF